MQRMGPSYVPPFPFRSTYLKGKDGDSVSSKGGQVILLQRPIRSSPAMRQTPELSPNSSSSESLSLAQRKKLHGLCRPKAGKNVRKRQQQGSKVMFPKANSQSVISLH